MTRRFEMVDRSRAELDRERNRTLLRELVAVQAQRQTRFGASGEIAPRLVGVERATLEEDVRGLRDFRRRGEHLREGEVEVRVCVAELRRHGMRTEPRRDTAGGFDRTQ